MAKSREELISMIENDLVDPSTNKITGERVKNALTEMVDAMGTGGGNMVYYEIVDTSSESLISIALISSLARTQGLIVPTAMLELIGQTANAYAIDLGLKIISNGQIATVEETLLMNFPDLSQIPGMKQISEQEFYQL